MLTTKPHVIVHGIPGIGYTRQAYREGQVIDSAGQRYRVTLVRNDGDVHGDGSDAIEVYTESEPENQRICQG